MSADAKVWMEQSGWVWKAVHDGPCRPALEYPHDQGSGLTEVILGVERCLGSLRWEIRRYPEGDGLVGWVA